MKTKIEKNWHYRAAGHAWIVPEYHLTQLPDGKWSVSQTELERINRLILRELQEWDACYDKRDQPRRRPKAEIEFLKDTAHLSPAPKDEDSKFCRRNPMHMSETAFLLELYVDPEHEFDEAALTAYILAQKMVPWNWEWLLEQPQTSPELVKHLMFAAEAAWYVRDKDRWENHREQYAELQALDPHVPPFPKVKTSQEANLLTIWTQFRDLQFLGAIPKNSRLTLFSDGSGRITQQEVVERNMEFGGSSKAIRVRTYELGLVSGGAVYMEEKPYPYQDHVRRTGWTHPKVKAST